MILITGRGKMKEKKRKEKKRKGKKRREEKEKMEVMYGKVDTK